VYKHVGLPPWEWREDDISEFIDYKVINDQIGIGRQALYFTYLRGLQNYILENRSLSNSIHIKFGMQLQRFVSDENAIPIKRKNKVREKMAKPLSPPQCEQLLQQFDSEIKQAKEFSSKSFQPLRRNKVMAQVALMTGVRVEELCELCVSNFCADPSYPNFGDFSLMTVVKGKGGKTRVVRLYNPMIRPVMEWYLDQVRPLFLNEKTTNPDRLFLSERGGDLNPEQVRRMLKKRAALAGITSNVHPHILRHTYATQMKKIIGAEALQRQLGHEHLSTTLGTYYHQDPLEVGGQVARGIDNFLDAIDEMTKGL
jgi:site-specific recombinase XerD